jgi:hypothetical protein
MITQERISRTQYAIIRLRRRKELRYRITHRTVKKAATLRRRTSYKSQILGSKQHYVEAAEILSGRAHGLAIDASTLLPHSPTAKRHFE